MIGEDSLPFASIRSSLWCAFFLCLRMKALEESISIALGECQATLQWTGWAECSESGWPRLDSLDSHDFWLGLSQHGADPIEPGLVAHVFALQGTGCKTSASISHCSFYPPEGTCTAMLSKPLVSMISWRATR